jgi:DNA repair photolyase
MHLEHEHAKSVLTRTCGYLESVCSHSLQPYRGCALGRSLCGIGCYVRHSGHLTRGRRWGDFLDVKMNAAEAYLAGYDRERGWARKYRGGFNVFLSSTTEPFPARELRIGVTMKVLEAMAEAPPDGLIVQTHSHHVAAATERLRVLRDRTRLRVHLSIESDRDRLPGLPPPASSVARRFEAAAVLKQTGIEVVVTVSPLLPIANPDRFFARIAEVADAAVLDHFIGGDGSPAGRGSRTMRTGLPAAMALVEPASVELRYRHLMGEIAEQYLPGRVGYSIDGFAGRWSQAVPQA